MMKKWEKGKIGELMTLAKKAPVQWVIATASKNYPDATADEIYNEVSTSNDPYTTAVMKFGLTPIYDHNKKMVQFSKEAILAVSPKKGQNAYALCPFHGDQVPGSFVITPSKAMWYCFTDGFGKSTIDFEMRFYGITKFNDAVYHLCYRMGYISKEEYKNKNAIKVNFDAVKSQENVAINQTEAPKADPDVIHIVYSAMALVSGLSPKDREHLITTRGLCEEDLKNYFTFPVTEGSDHSSTFVRRMFKLIRDRFAYESFKKKFEELTREEKEAFKKHELLNKIVKQMPLVPGFYLDINSRRVKFTGRAGIGIMAKDENGKCVGIQIRAYKKSDNAPRYTWFSSASLNGEAGIYGGASSGSPGGIIYPKSMTDKSSICITEGRFKAEAIAKAGNIAIYVSGVSSWNSIIPMLKSIKGSRNKAFLMFDADVLQNSSVYRQLSALSEALKELGLDPFVLTWREEYGKGFDDLMLQNRNYRALLKSIKFDEFKAIYEERFSMLLDLYHVDSYNKMSPDTRAKFNHDLSNVLAAMYQLPLKK